MFYVRKEEGCSIQTNTNMDWTVGSQRSLKVLGYALRCATLSNNDIVIEARSNELRLVGVNSSQSSVSSFIFKRNFFEEYSASGLGSANSVRSSSNNRGCDSSSVSDKSSKVMNRVCCSFQSRAFLPIIRAIISSTGGKDFSRKYGGGIKRCIMRLDSDFQRSMDSVMVKLEYNKGLVKTYNLIFSDGQLLRALCSRDVSNSIAIRPKVLMECLSAIHPTQDTVMLKASKEDSSPLRIITHEDADPLGKNDIECAQTEIKFAAMDFQRCTIGLESCFIFSLKDMRCFLAFADAVEMPIHMFFEKPGDPILLSLDSDPSFAVNIVLATASPDYDMTTDKVTKKSRPSYTGEVLASAATTPMQSQRQMRSPGGNGNTTPSVYTPKSQSMMSVTATSTIRSGAAMIDAAETSHSDNVAPHIEESDRNYKRSNGNSEDEEILAPATPPQDHVSSNHMTSSCKDAMMTDAGWGLAKPSQSDSMVLAMDTSEDEL